MKVLKVTSVMASSMSKSKECRKSVYKYLNRIVESGFPSSSVAELHFKLLCSYDLKKAENYIEMNIKNDTLQCNPLDALRCLRVLVITKIIFNYNF